VQDDAPVTDRYVGHPVGIDPVWAVPKDRMLNHAEQVDRDALQQPSLALRCLIGGAGPAAHQPAPGSAWYQLARFASGSSTSANASAGPLISVLGPGPWPNSMHCPVEITPMVR